MEDSQMDDFKKLVSESEYLRFIDFLVGINDGSIEKTTLFTFASSIDDKAIRS